MRSRGGDVLAQSVLLVSPPPPKFAYTPKPDVVLARRLQHTTNNKNSSWWGNRCRALPHTHPPPIELAPRLSLGHISGLLFRVEGVPYLQNVGGALSAANRYLLVRIRSPSDSRKDALRASPMVWVGRIPKQMPPDTILCELSLFRCLGG